MAIDEIDIEIPKARSLYKSSAHTVRNLLREIAKGKRTEISELHEMVDELFHSTQRNPHALLCLCQSNVSDDKLAMHCLNTCIINCAFSLALGHSVTEIKALALGGLFADVGKFRIPQEVLFKTSPLSSEEEVLVKNHVKLSYALIARIPKVSDLTLQAILDHHELVDGSGYPSGKSTDSISLSGKITAISDTYDRLINGGAEKIPEEPTDAIKKMMSWTTKRLDKKLMEKFVQFMGIYPVGTLVVLNNGQLSVVLKQNPESLLLPTVRTIFDMKKKSMLEDREVINPGASGLKVLTHAKRNTYKINPLSALGKA